MTYLIDRETYPRFMQFLAQKGLEHDYDVERRTMIIPGHGEISLRECGYLCDDNMRDLVMEFFARS
jgi:hypothetical protein